MVQKHSDKTFFAKLTGSPWRIIVVYLLVFFAFDYLRYGLIIPSDGPTWYPPIGVSLAFLLIFGPAYAPVVFGASIFSIVFVWQFHLPQTAILILATIHSVVPTLVAMLLRRKRGVILGPKRLQDMYWLFLGMTTAAVLIAMWVESVYALYSLYSPPVFVAHMLSTWGIHLLNMIAIVPLLLWLAAPPLDDMGTEQTGAGIKNRLLHLLGVLFETLVVLVFIWLVLGTVHSGALHIAPLMLIPMIGIALRHTLRTTMAIFLALYLGTLVGLYWVGLAPDNVVDLSLLLLAAGVLNIFVGAGQAESARSMALLRDSEERLNLIVNSLPAVVYYADTDLRYRFINERSLSWYGVTPEAARNRHVSEVIGEAAFEIAREPMAQALAGEEVHFATTVVYSNGMSRDVEANYIPHMGENGMAKGFVALIQDVGRRKQMEQEIRDALELNQKILSVSTLAIAVFKSADECVLVNEAAARLVGVDRETILRNPRTILASMRSSIKDAAQEALLSGIERRYEAEAILECGRHVWLDCWLVPFMAKGERHLLVVGDDITARKDTEEELFQHRHHLEEMVQQRTSELETANHELQQAVRRQNKTELALRDSEQRFRQLADAMPQLVWTAQPDGVVDYYNARINEFENFSQEKDGHWTWTPGVHPDDRASTVEAWRHAVETGEQYQIEHRIYRVDGSVRWYLSRAVPIYDETGAIGRWYGTATDIHDQKEAEQALRENESRLELAQGAAGFGVWDWDIVQGVEVWSPTMYDLYGFDPSDPVHHGQAREVVHPDDNEPSRESIRQALQSGEDWRHEFRIQHPQRGTRWIAGIARPFYDEHQQPVRMIGVNLDVTERKQRERELEVIAAVSAALREADTRTEMLPVLLDVALELLSAQDAVLISYDAESGDAMIEMARGAWTESIGMVFESGSTVEHLSRATGRSISGEQILPMLTPPHPHALTSDQILVGAPLIVQAETIGALWVGRSNNGDNSAIAPAFLDDDIRLLTTIADMTASALDRAALHEQVQAYAQQVRQILDSVDDGLVLLDSTRRVQLANPAGLDHLQHLAQAKIGDRLEQLGDQSLPKLLARTPHPLHSELQVQNGRTRNFEISIHTLQHGAATDGWVIVSRDVTQSRQIQQRIEQQARLAAVGQLAAGIAHDFNNILAVITLYNDLLRRSSRLSEREHGWTEIVFKQAEQAGNLVQQILDFSRRTVMERSAMDLAPFVKETAQLWRRMLPEHINVRLECGSKPSTVNGDPARLQQALMNLAVNARDAMTDGGELRVELDQIWVDPAAPAPFSDLSPGHWVRLVIADTGEGIGSENLAHIFEPFFTTKAPGKGTGLGLAQVYGIVRQHDGFIQVASRMHQGTTFTLYFPLLAEQTYNGVPASELMLEQSGEQGQTSGQSVLLVEDNEHARAVAVEALTALGIDAYTAQNGRVAIEMLASGEFPVDMVISDLIMPEVNGLELYDYLRRDLPNVNMIMMTGYPLEAKVRAFLEEEKVEWLQKPFDLKALEIAIRTTRKLRPLLPGLRATGRARGPDALAV